MSARFLYSALLLTALLAVSAHAQDLAQENVDYGPLGKGSIDVSFTKAKLGVVVELRTDLDTVAGIVLSLPESQRNVAAVTSGRARGVAKDFLSTLEADAKVEVDAKSLAGQRPQIVLPVSLAGVHRIRLTMVAQDGKQYPLVFNAKDFNGQAIKTSLTGQAGPCHDVTLTCSNGCNVTVNCCSLVTCERSKSALWETR